MVALQWELIMHCQLQSYRVAKWALKLTSFNLIVNPFFSHFSTARISASRFNSEQFQQITCTHTHWHPALHICTHSPANINTLNLSHTTNLYPYYIVHTRTRVHSAHIKCHCSRQFCWCWCFYLHSRVMRVLNVCGDGDVASAWAGCVGFAF